MRGYHFVHDFGDTLRIMFDFFPTKNRRTVCEIFSVTSSRGEAVSSFSNRLPWNYLNLRCDTTRTAYYNIATAHVNQRPDTSHTCRRLCARYGLYNMRMRNVYPLSNTLVLALTNDTSFVLLLLNLNAPQQMPRKLVNEPANRCAAAIVLYKIIVCTHKYAHARTQTHEISPHCVRID